MITLKNNIGEKTMNKPECIKIDDVEYVRSDILQQKAETVDGLERVIVRSYGAGVFIGYLADKKAELNGVNITLKKSKRIYYWAGACSLTQLAIDGTCSPNDCKITDAVESQFIANVIEIIPVTKKAELSIDGVKLWKK
jgi:hypothetical protein